MTIPIVSNVIGFVGEKVLWRILRFTVFRLAKTFVGKYKPDVHAKLSRKWEWERAWKPMIAKAEKTPSPFDDPVVRFAYFHQACYIEDGTLCDILKRAKDSVDMNEVNDHIKHALKLIELSNED